MIRAATNVLLGIAIMSFRNTELCMLMYYMYLSVVGMSLHHLIGFPVQVHQNSQCTCLPRKVIGLHIHTQVLGGGAKNQSECGSHMLLLAIVGRHLCFTAYQSVPLNGAIHLAK